METKAKCTELAESFCCAMSMAGCTWTRAGFGNWQLQTGQGVHVRSFRQRKSSCEVKTGRKEKKTCGAAAAEVRTDPGPSNIHGRIYQSRRWTPQAFFCLSTGDRPVLFCQRTFYAAPHVNVQVTLRWCGFNLCDFLFGLAQVMWDVKGQKECKIV